jgi:hypothetical protein
MGFHTGNEAVVKALQDALQDFLADQRQCAEKNDPEWASKWKRKTPAEQKNYPGCGCEDCTIAGQLLGSIY